MKLMITTQIQENYGAHDWDGTGACPQYWKFKGGNDYSYSLGAYLRNPEVLAELVEAFNAIQSPKARAALMRLARSMAENDAESDAD